MVKPIIFPLFFVLLFSVVLFGKKNLGHRLGGDVYSPENTLVCYRKALESLQDKPDFLYAELDVQETKDGKIVVFHDTKSIRRLVPRSAHNVSLLKEAFPGVDYNKIQIKDLTARQVTQLELKGGARIPSLEEVLEASVKWNLQKPMLVEIKSLHSDEGRKELLSIVKRYDEKLQVNFMAFPNLFERSFPDPLRGKISFKRNGFKVYTAKKPKVKKFNLTKDVSAKELNWDYKTVLKRESFVIKGKGENVCSFPVKLPESIGKGCFLRVGIHHGHDDSGDGGVKFRLVTGESGGEVLTGFSKSRKWKWFETKVGAERDFTLILEDHDTKDSGQYPGNAGAVKVAIVTRGEF